MYLKNLDLISSMIKLIILKKILRLYINVNSKLIENGYKEGGKLSGQLI